MAKDLPRLASALIARKGEATPTINAPPTSVVDQPPIPVESHGAAGKIIPKGLAGTIAVTVRLDPNRYEHLKMYGVRKRLTNQQIIVAALDAYLASPKGE